MPTYDYRCEACGHVFELFERITADGNTKVCPKCNKCKAKRQIGAGGGFLFRGSGFYTTDYKKSNGSPTPSNSDAKPAKSAGSEKSSGKKD